MDGTVAYPFVLSLFLVFAAEMGDKTQLVALAFATRYHTRTVPTARQGTAERVVTQRRRRKATSAWSSLTD